MANAIQLNDKKLAKFRLQGNAVPMLMKMWRVGHDSVPRVNPGVGGITLNFKVGDLANQFVSDHLEPGVTTSTDTDERTQTQSSKNIAYNTFSCIGNEATVISGAAKGKKGRVTGHHGGCEHVMLDFDDKTLHQLTYNDKFMITAFGSGLEIEGFEDKIRVYSLDPDLLRKMKPRIVDGRVEIAVAVVVPAVVMGSGLGDNQPFHGDYDIQTSDDESNRKYGLDKLRIGDVVAILDHDSTAGWSYKQGAVSIGVIIHGDSMIAGHGPGCQTILTSRDGFISVRHDKNANIGRYLQIGRFRKGH